MAPNPLSKELNRTGYGYRMTTGHGETAKRHLISHLLHMDDLKLYGRNSDQLDGLLHTVRTFLLHTVRTFSDNIQMNFVLDKCAVAHFVNSRLSGHNSGVTVGKADINNSLEPGQVYKYLGVGENNGIWHNKMQDRLRREYFRRVKVVLRTDLYGRNKILAITGFALAVCVRSWRHSLGLHRPAAARSTDQKPPLYVHCPSSCCKTLTDCTLLAVMGVGVYNRLRRPINVVL